MLMMSVRLTATMLTPVGIPIPGMHVYTYLIHQCIEVGDEVSLHLGQIVPNVVVFFTCMFFH